MKVILSYTPESATKIVKGHPEQIDPFGWLAALSKRYGSFIEYEGRDEKKRVEVSMSVSLFSCIKNDPLFIMEAEHLRRIRTEGQPNILEFLAGPRINYIDNDLDTNRP